MSHVSGQSPESPTSTRAALYIQYLRVDSKLGKLEIPPPQSAGTVFEQTPYSSDTLDISSYLDSNLIIIVIPL